MLTLIEIVSPCDFRKLGPYATGFFDGLWLPFGGLQVLVTCKGGRGGPAQRSLFARSEMSATMPAFQATERG